MAKPTKSGPDADITGVDRPPRAGMPNTDPAKGTAEDIEKAERESIGRPPDSGKLSTKR